MKKQSKETLTGICVLLLYLLFSSFFLIILSILGIKYNSLSNNYKNILSIISEVILISIIVIIYKNVFTNDLKNYKNNIKKYISQYIKYWFLAITLMTISNTIITILTNINTSTNQEQVLKLFHKNPIYTFILTVFLAPLLEELVFRLSFRKMFKNDYLFIIISGLVFGSLHLSSASSVLELLYIIPYSIPGWIFAYTLVKSKNIFVPISLHFIHNASLMLLQIILLFI